MYVLHYVSLAHLFFKERKLEYFDQCGVCIIGGVIIVDVCVQKLEGYNRQVLATARGSLVTFLPFQQNCHLPLKVGA